MLNVICNVLFRWKNLLSSPFRRHSYIKTCQKYNINMIIIIIYHSIYNIYFIYKYYINTHIS